MRFVNPITLLCSEFKYLLFQNIIKKHSASPPPAPGLGGEKVFFDIVKKSDFSGLLKNLTFNFFVVLWVSENLCV